MANTIIRNVTQNMLCHTWYSSMACWRQCFQSAKPKASQQYIRAFFRLIYFYFMSMYMCECLHVYLCTIYLRSTKKCNRFPRIRSDRQLAVCCIWVLETQVFCKNSKCWAISPDHKAMLLTLLQVVVFYLFCCRWGCLIVL